MRQILREVGLLLRPKWLAVRRRRGQRGRAGRALIVVAVGGAAWPFIYVALVRLLTALRGVEEIGPLLAARLLGLALLLFLGILLLSNLIASLSSFFLARDLPVIRAAPVDWLSVYAARLVETTVSSSWMVLLVLVPVVVAYARVYGGGLAFLGVVVAALVPFLLIPAAVGSALTLLLVRVFPARRSRDILAVTGMAAAALLVLVLRALRPERLVNPETYRNLVDFLAVLRAPASPWLPSGWGSDAMMGALVGGFDPFHLVLLWTTAGAAFVLGAVLHARLYPACFTKAQEGSENRIRSHLGWRWLEAVLRPLGVQRRELMLKDVRDFFRDTTQWSQLIILGVLVVVYVYNMRVLPLATTNGALSRHLVNLVVFLNLALTGFVLAAIAARFIFPMPSLEGRTLWLLLSAPVDADTLLGAKFRVGIVPLTAMALALTVATGLIIDVPAGLFALNLLAIVGLGAAFTAQALAWGVLYPQFESENAAQIPTSLGGMLFMLGALATLGLVVYAQMWALRGFLLSGLPGRLPRAALPAELSLAAGLTVAICAVGSIVPFRLAVRRLSTIGRWSTES